MPPLDPNSLEPPCAFEPPSGDHQRRRRNKRTAARRRARRRNLEEASSLAAEYAEAQLDWNTVEGQARRDLPPATPAEKGKGGCCLQ